MVKTRLSVKGQVVIPKQVREMRGWQPGLEILIEDAGDGILLRPVKPFRKTSVKEVLGCTGYKGRRKSLKDMETAIRKGVSDRQ